MSIRRRMWTQPVPARFHIGYYMEPMSGCWLWEGTLKNGYGLMKIAKAPVYAHRLSWQLHKGPIPDGMEICHRCDIKCCVNPSHLFVGTHYDNMIDAWNKGRTKKPPSRSGELHSMAKLVPAQIDVIRQRWAEGESSPRIARDFGVTDVQIRNIVNRRSWRHYGV